MKQLSVVFAIDICAFAILDNHYHVILRVDQDQVARWEDREVAKRWKVLFKGDTLINTWFSDKTYQPNQTENDKITKTFQL